MVPRLGVPSRNYYIVRLELYSETSGKLVRWCIESDGCDDEVDVYILVGES